MLYSDCAALAVTKMMLEISEILEMLDIPNCSVKSRRDLFIDYCNGRFGLDHELVNRFLGRT